MKKLELMKGPFSPKEKIEYAEGSIVSQEFIHNRAGNLTLFSFDEGQQLSEHTAPFDAVCQILDGEAEIHIAEDVYRLTEGQMLIMPANVPHSVHAVKAFKMRLSLITGPFSVPAEQEKGVFIQTAK